ncbi:MAG: hypothetical protein K8F27_07465, partial [Sulfuricellaceae bacterium]|nr:hypothetical protein [Sulfuricellaceae bacterium]
LRDGVLRAPGGVARRLCGMTTPRVSLRAQHPAKPRRDPVRLNQRLLKQEADGWIGWIEEVPGVNCQESSREALLQSLRETLIEAIELNRADVLDAAGKKFEELPIAV